MNTARSLRPFNILFADDGSEHCLAAAKLISDLPLPPQSSVTLLTVCPQREASSLYRVRYNQEGPKAILQEKGLHIRSKTVVGYPAETITEFADQLLPDLIVMGAKGLRATLGIFLGGVVQQVMEYGNWPVLVVRMPYHGLKRVILPVDGSAHSRCTMEYLARFPLNEDLELTLLHVLPPPLAPNLYIQSLHVGPEIIQGIPSHELEEMAIKQAEAETQEGKKILVEASEFLASQGLQAKTELLRGDAATEIIDFTKSHETDLVVAGSRGLGPVRSWLLGSVSRKLGHYAKCSVLFVKGHP